MDPIEELRWIHKRIAGADTCSLQKEVTGLNCASEPTTGRGPSRGMASSCFWFSIAKGENFHKGGISYVNLSHRICGHCGVLLHHLVLTSGLQMCSLACAWIPRHTHIHMDECAHTYQFTLWMNHGRECWCFPRVASFLGSKSGVHCQFPLPKHSAHICITVGFRLIQCRYPSSGASRALPTNNFRKWWVANDRSAYDYVVTKQCTCTEMAHRAPPLFTITSTRQR